MSKNLQAYSNATHIPVGIILKAMFTAKYI